MPDADRDLRPQTEKFECHGCRVTLVDPPGILATAANRRVELLHGAAFPAPVRQVRFNVTGPAGDHPDGPPAHRLEAEIRLGGAAPPAGWIDRTVLGNDPIGVLITRSRAAGEVWATRLVDGVGTAAAEVYRRLGLGRATATGVDDAVREDPATGLRATVTSRPAPARTPGAGGQIVTVRAEVDTPTPEHLRAAFCLVLGVVADLVEPAGGDNQLAGRAYVLTRNPSGYRPAQPERARSAAPDPGGTDRGGEQRPGTGPVGARPTPAEPVNLDQVGGLDRVVDQFRQVAVSFQHPEVMARWGARRPQGILMYGPPGTGKTMLARALATEIGAELREIRTPEILDKWLGASERNIKRIFRSARSYRVPTVLLFDEFDSIISYAGAGGDAASQAVNAVAGIFKQEMNDLIEDNPNVIVVATTNFPHRVDESLTRSGRFDIKIAVPLPDEAGRQEILAKMIRQLIARHERPGFRMFADDLDPRGLAAASQGMTGADLKEALRRVQLAKAMQEARTGTPAAPIGQDDLLRGIAEVRTTPTTG